MKKVSVCVLALLVFASSAYGQILKKPTSPVKPVKKLVIFDDRGGVFAPTGWMGDPGSIGVDVKCKTKPHSGKYCQKWTYTVKPGQKEGWAGVYWQHPPENWGKRKGYDLTGYRKLSFWARGDKGGELVEFKMGGMEKEKYPDTYSKSLGKIRLTTGWKEYMINVSGKDLSNIAGGFCWAAAAKENPKGCIFYLDDIAYE